MSYYTQDNEDFKSAQSWYKIAKEQNNQLAIEILEKHFPELKESEDERIRKEILRLLSYIDISDKDRIRWTTWLEKQGEQKPSNKVEPKFKVGDRINKIGREEADSTILTVIRVDTDDECYTCDQGSVFAFKKENEWYKIEEKFSWNEEDECMMDNILNDEMCPLDIETINWLKSLKKRMKGE